MRVAHRGHGKPVVVPSRQLLGALFLALAFSGAGLSAVSPAAAGGPRDDPAFDRAAARAVQSRQERDERRNSVEARRDRAVSRERFRSIGRSDARALAQRSFATLQADIWRPIRLRDGESFAGYRNDYSAQIDRIGKPPLIAQTFVPMRDRAVDGSTRRVSLGLVEQATSITPRNPLVDLSIARASDGPLRLRQVGLSVTPAVDEVAGVVDGDRVYAEGVGVDLDQIVQPTVLGAQLMWQVRSADSPEAVRLHVGMPDGTHLRLNNDDLVSPYAASNGNPPRSVEIVDGEEVLARIEAPATVDADGEAVASFYEIEGHDVIVHFPHHGLDLEYPLLVDPTVTETWGGNDWGSDNWTSAGYQMGGPTPFSFARNCCGRTGLQAGAYQYGTYYDGAVAQWVWNTYHDSYIYRADFGGLDQIDAGNTLFTGVFNTQTSQWESLSHDTLTFNGYGRTHYASSDDNAAVFGMQMHGSYQRTAGPGLVSMSNMTLYLGDRYPPTITASEHSYDGRWTNQDSAQVRLIAADRGLGLVAAGVARTDRGDPNAGTVPNDYWLSLAYNTYCQGNRRALCVNSFDTAASGSTFPNGKLTYLLTPLPEGTSQVRASAHQYEGGQYGTAAFTPTWTVRIDRTAPSAPVTQLELPQENVAQVTWAAATDPKPADGTFSDVAEYRVRYRVNSGTFGPWISYPANARASSVTPSYADGTTISFEVVAVDGAGNISATATESDQVEGDKPLVDNEGNLADANGGYVAAAPANLTVSAEDPGSGVQKLQVKRIDGAVVAQQVIFCPNGVCPATASRSLSVDFSSYPEGSVALAVNATDALQNESNADDVEVLVDRTAPATPPAPQQVAGGTTDTAVIAWAQPGDPALDVNTPGSGNSFTRYRVKPLTGSFGPWQTSTDGTARVSLLAADLLTVELQSVDAVGNASAIGSYTIPVVPDALLADVGPARAQEYNDSLSDSASGELADPDTYAQDEDPAATPRATSAQDENDASDEKPPCLLFVDNTIPRGVPARPREFLPLRTRLEAGGYIFCNGPPTTSGFPSNTVDVQLSLSLHYKTDLGFKALGPRRTRSLGVPKYFQEIPLAGMFSNLCTPEAGGTRQYVLYGTIKFVRDGAVDLVEHIYSEPDKARDGVCPDAGKRRLREAAAYSVLSRYRVNTADPALRSPSSQLRLELGSEPYKPQGVVRGWDAHHVIPVRDRRARIFRARAFRCKVHPNDPRNGLYLRGFGLRKTRNGKETRAYRDLKTVSPALAGRAYHADTFGDLYFTRLDTRLAVVPEYCQTPDRNALVGSMSGVSGDLATSRLGVEQAGH